MYVHMYVSVCAPVLVLLRYACTSMCLHVCAHTSKCFHVLMCVHMFCLLPELGICLLVSRVLLLTLSLPCVSPGAGANIF